MFDVILSWLLSPLVTTNGAALLVILALVMLCLYLVRERKG